MSKTNIHSAEGSFLGFLFQVERVLLWLSEGSENSKVGIETDDDIVVQLKNGDDINYIYEQAKNAKTKGLPFSDKSEDLWKTLSIWVQAVIDGRINPENAIFSAITNKKLPPNRLLFELASAKKSEKKQMDDLIAKLKDIANGLSKDNKAFGETIINCDNKILANIIDSIYAFDGTYHHERKKLKLKLKANLSMSSDLPFDHIYNNLFGHVTNVIIDCWRSNQEAWISVESFNKLYVELVAQYHNKSFFERATELLPINNSQIDNNRKSIYVEQLKIIDFDETEVLEAIHDYLRSKSEKSRYAKEFEVTETKFNDYYEDLRQHWIKISRPRFKINPQNLPLEQIGYGVFYETIMYKGKLNNQEPEQAYTYKGAYHHLTNECHIGWHPSWQDKFKIKKDEGNQ